jgi:hypothetical protein
VEEPNESESKKNLLFRGTLIEQDELDLSTFFYTKQNPGEQAQPTPYQSFTLGGYQSPVTFELSQTP